MNKEYKIAISGEKEFTMNGNEIKNLDPYRVAFVDSYVLFKSKVTEKNYSMYIVDYKEIFNK
jgi:tmRNA-binding protein